MEFQNYLDYWSNFTVGEIDFATLYDIRVILFVGFLFVMLYSKIGIFKSLLLVPCVTLVELVLYNSIELTNNSYIATFVFMLISGILATCLIYLFFIKDHSSCNQS